MASREVTAMRRPQARWPQAPQPERCVYARVRYHLPSRVCQTTLHSSTSKPRINYTRICASRLTICVRCLPQLRRKQQSALLSKTLQPAWLSSARYADLSRSSPPAAQSEAGSDRVARGPDAERQSLTPVFAVLRRTPGSPADQDALGRGLLCEELRKSGSLDGSRLHRESSRSSRISGRMDLRTLL